MTAKLTRPNACGVDPVVVRGRRHLLPGEISRLILKGVLAVAVKNKIKKKLSRREKSAEAVLPLGNAGRAEQKYERVDMNLDDIKRQKSKPQQMELPLDEPGEARGVRRSVEMSTAKHEVESSSLLLMEEVVESSNVKEALKRVKKNKGSPGVDGMRVEELSAYVESNWNQIREELLAGWYQPLAVRRVEIPKASGGIRQLGIPCAVDRFIQQMILQVLQPRFDPTFSDHSYGFRPGRSAHDAIRRAQAYIQEGRRWVVDVDLESFFDRVNHDILMSRLAQRIADKRMLKLIRRYLEAGMMGEGVVMEREEGTPQGGPLSPLLANVLLDEVDKELEKRGHAFVRYADDCNVYVSSERAAQGMMETLKKRYAQLRLKVNETKSRVARFWDGKFLGYSFWTASGGNIRLRVAPKALQTMKNRVREITSRTAGRSLTQTIQELRGYLNGWKEYFRLADTPTIFSEMDGWIRRRLRMGQLKQWKRGTTIHRELLRRGIPSRGAKPVAGMGGRWWAGSVLPAIKTVMSETYFTKQGLPTLVA